MTSGVVSIVFYTLVFLALYSQLFFLYSFFIERTKKNHLEIIPENFKDIAPPISILMPCWNEESTVESSIESLLALHYPKEKLHIVAIDDGSTDGTWKKLELYQNHPNITILRKENGGKHTAHNYALPYVKTELVCAIDADTRITPDALQNIVSYFLNNPAISAVGGNVLIGNPKTLVQRAQSVEYQMFSYTKKVLGLLGGVLVAPGAFSVFKTEALREVGGYRCAHNMEDLELTYRLQKEGYVVEQSHNALAYTKGPDSIKSLFKQRLRWGYGFLNNTFDYRELIFNKKYGNFGFFTLPLGILSYTIILTVFTLSWVKIFSGLIEKITIARLAGFDATIASIFSFNWFYIDTQALSVLTAVAFILIIVSIFFGRKVSKVTRQPAINIVLFFLLYNFLAPFWIIKSVYNSIVAIRPNWR
jgi:cellulose synthase/poly-beta-1,6-N-acetylglucosamine synthase-like glycosyltransferase